LRDHLLLTFAKLCRRGGVRAVAAESLLLKQQLLISSRSRQRAPNLTTRDRFMLWLTTLFVSRRRVATISALLSPSTFSSSITRWSIANIIYSFLRQPNVGGPDRRDRPNQGYGRPFLGKSWVEAVGKA